MRLKKSGRIAIILLLCLGGFGFGYWWLQKPQEVGQSATVGKISIPDAPEASLTGSAAVQLGYPSKKESFLGASKMTIMEMAWNSQTSLNYANGGIMTTENSLIEKAGWKVSIVKRNDCAQAQAELIKWISDYKSGVTKEGMVAIWMGTGIPNYINGIANAVKELGPEYAPIAFFSSGKSYGEDQVIGPIEMKDNKQLLKGSVCRGVKLDGDLDEYVKLCGDNNVKVNANDKVYDPEAGNMSYAADYLSAVVDYNAGKEETRKLVVNGKTTKDTTVAINMVATWTPGDVNAIIKGKGGVTLISTRDYASMMPNIYVTCKKFLNDYRDKEKGSISQFMSAVLQAGDQVRTFEEVKKYATGLNATIWGEETPEYWYKHYNGYKYNQSYLGGSMVYNLADIDKLFGLRGGVDVYREVYNAFGKKQSELYPKDLPKFPDYTQVMDKSFMMNVVSNNGDLLAGKAQETEYKDNITEIKASRDVKINFEFNSAQILPSSYEALNELYSSAITAEGLKVGVYGHTDNVGSDEKNLNLSQARARAVSDYLTGKGLARNRIESKGFGETQPLESNDTEQGRSQNRRVQIVLGN